MGEMGDVHSLMVLEAAVDREPTEVLEKTELAELVVDVVLMDAERPLRWSSCRDAGFHQLRCFTLALWAPSAWSSKESGGNTGFDESIALLPASRACVSIRGDVGDISCDLRQAGPDYWSSLLPVQAMNEALTGKRDICSLGTRWYENSSNESGIRGARRSQALRRSSMCLRELLSQYFLLQCGPLLRTPAHVQVAEGASNKEAGSFAHARRVRS